MRVIMTELPGASRKAVHIKSKSHMTLKEELAALQSRLQRTQSILHLLVPGCAPIPAPDLQADPFCSRGH